MNFVVIFTYLDFSLASKSSIVIMNSIFFKQ